MSDNSASLLGKIAGYTEILAKDPQSTVFVSLCEAYRQLGMLDDALEIAQKGTKSLTGFSPGFVALGRIHAQQGDLADAANAFEKALAIENGSLPALKGLARTRYRQGYLDKAKDLLLRARQISPEDPIVLKMLTSLEPVTTPSTVVPDPVDVSPTVEQTSSTVVVPQRDTHPAEAEVQGEASPIPTATLADIYMKQGLYSEAATVYRDILRQDPSNVVVRDKLVALKEKMQASQEDIKPEVAEPLDVQSTPDSVENPTVSDDTEPNEKTHDSKIEIYHRWLNAIEKRRAHVC